MHNVYDIISIFFTKFIRCAIRILYKKIGKSVLDHKSIHRKLVDINWAQVCLHFTSSETVVLKNNKVFICESFNIKLPITSPFIDKIRQLTATPNYQALFFTFV